MIELATNTHITSIDTGTADTADTSDVPTLYRCDGGVYNIAKTAIEYALAVR